MQRFWLKWHRKTTYRGSAKMRGTGAIRSRPRIRLAAIIKMRGLGSVAAKPAPSAIHHFDDEFDDEFC